MAYAPRPARLLSRRSGMRVSLSSGLRADVAEAAERIGD
jgi:hypothetical protein